MRRRLARRSQLVAARTRAKNEIHAILFRRLKGRPDVSDLFGKKGREGLAELELPVEERETLDSGLRQIDLLGTEVALVEGAIAHDALNWPAARRLMPVRGVNLIVAVTFLATVGDIHRFPDRRKLVGYLGLDPKVRQSGDAPAAHGHISKQGSSQARHALVEASWSAVRTPGPLHAYPRAAATRAMPSGWTRARPTELRVDVCNRGLSFDLTELEPPSLDRAGGWGLRIVELVSQRWGVEPDGDRIR